MAPHHFVLDDQPEIEGVGVKEMLERMYYSDFCECNHLQVNSILGDMKDISREDRKFLDILDTGIKRMGHVMKYLYHTGILAFNSLTAETKLLKYCIM